MKLSRLHESHIGMKASALVVLLGCLAAAMAVSPAPTQTAVAAPVNNATVRYH